MSATKFASKKSSKRPGAAAPKGAWYEGYEARLQKVIGILERGMKRKSGPRWTYVAIAEWTGVSHQTIRNLLTGATRFPTHHVIDRRCQGLGIRVKYED